MKNRYAILILSIIIFIAVIGAGTVNAENIDPNNDNSQYAYGENGGWLNFEATNGGAEVTNSTVTGDVWAENIGWIRLNPTGFGGVTHDGAGNLSGHAWSENAGWINFNPTNGGVTINTSTGDFDGYAWGENVGWVHFQNATPAYKVNTSWRVAAAAAATPLPRSRSDENCANGSDDDGDGLIDCADDDCNFNFACVENCSDGIDNDGNGLIDCDDPDCFSEQVCDRPPVVVITAPAGNDTVSETVTISANVTDDKGFKFIDVLLDGQLLSGVSFSSAKTDEKPLLTWNTGLNGDDGAHTIKVSAKDAIDQTGSDEIHVVVNNGFSLPLEIISPVAGMFHIDTGTQKLPPDDWSFWQHKKEALGHGRGGGVGNANDTMAWDVNLGSGDTDGGDADAGKPVFSVAAGVVAETYAGCENAGGQFGQVLIDHTGWWSGYLHMGDISVRPGDSVDEKTQLGIISNTGTVTNYLHFVAYAGNNLSGCENNPDKGGLESFNVSFLERGALAPNPIAEFSASHRSGEAPLTVQFTDISQPSTEDAQIISWDWDFGDSGAKSAVKNPTHTYNIPGTFTVSLEVTASNAGIDKETKADFIQVKEAVISTPEATATPTPTPTLVATPTPEATATPTPEATATPTPEATTTPTPEATTTVPEVTVTPTSEETATPAPTETATVTPTPEVTATATPTPFVAKLTTLEVSPSKLKSGLVRPAVVTAKDQNGDQMLGVMIKAKAEGEKATVSSKKARTGTDGTAKFIVSFESGTKNGRITFSARGLTAVITQTPVIRQR